MSIKKSPPFSARTAANPWNHDMQRLLSAERLASYMRLANGDVQAALNIYRWNTGASSAFYEALQEIEVGLRNALHAHLVVLRGPDWYARAAAFLDSGAVRRVRELEQRFLQQQEPITPSNAVAGLSFGFWTSLLSRGATREDGRPADYETTLWRPALRRAFPHAAPLKRHDVHATLREMAELRNRIAHHEPIFGRQLGMDYLDILKVAGWIDPLLRDWIEAHSRVPDLLRAAPPPLSYPP